MSTFTKEQLIQKLKHRISVASGFPDSEKAKMDLELARIALASLEAEPVAFIGQRMLEELTDGSRSCGRVWSEVTDKLSDENRIPLYTAPPAPVSVPDEIRLLQSEVRIWKDRWELLRELFREVADALGCDVKENQAMLDKIEMLQGSEPVINRDELPHGWVACSERMPETMVSVLVTGTWFHHAVAFWDGLCWCDLDFEQPVTHWMPLPAAPQQEVK